MILLKFKLLFIWFIMSIVEVESSVAWTRKNREVNFSTFNKKANHMFTNKNNTHFTAYVSSQGLVRLSLTPSQSRVSSKSVIDIFAVCILVWLSCELISLQMMQNIQIACCTNSMSNFFFSRISLGQSLCSVGTTFL
jgi:hypothetical protein